ncbi:MAG: lipopolysaccharide biosynthesis protein [Spirochaetales bacterium]
MSISILYNKKAKNKITIDVLLNIVSSALPIGLLQLIIQPLVSRRIGADSYGLMLTLIGISQIGIGVSGNTLNNLRLLSDREYVEKGISGDFNLLLVYSLFMNTLIMGFATWYYNSKFDFINIISIIAISSLGIIYSYLAVEYRLKLDYRRILINSIWQAVGYGVGFGAFIILGYWQVIFISGYIASVVHIVLTTSLLKEPLHKTIFFSATSKRMAYLVGAVALSSVLTYLDRLLLYPLLGGKQVSIYYTASLIGKVLALVAVPMAGVFLSYIAKTDSIKPRQYMILVVILLSICFIGYWVCLWMSTPMIRILYPDWATETLVYVPFTAATAMIGIFATMLNPLILRFSKMQWQIAIQSIYMAFYISISLFSLSKWGLLGFCIGVLIATSIKALIMIPIGLSGVKNLEINKKQDIYNI